MTTIIFVALVTALFSAQVNCAKKQVYEPQFEYEYKVLETLVNMEKENENIRSAVSNGNERIASLTDMLEATYDTISYLNATVNILRSQNRGSGSTYIRWGRTTCEGDAQVVYDGFAAGAYYSHTGSGSNYICLPQEPKWGQYDDRTATQGLLYGVEYELGGNHQEQDAPCVVCRIPRSNVLMTPGTNECQDGWVLEYWGYLVSQSYNQQSKDFVCLDEEPEYLDHGAGNKNGGLFYYVEGRCGSLQCPPYVNGRELTCAVCSYGKRG